MQTHQGGQPGGSSTGADAAPVTPVQDITLPMTRDHSDTGFATETLPRDPIRGNEFGRTALAVGARPKQAHLLSAGPAHHIARTQWGWRPQCI